MAFDAFMKIATIDGESQDAKHKKWVELLSYSHGVSQQAGGARSTSGAASGGRTDHQDFHVTKLLDAATPKLNLACSNGEHIKEVKIELCRATKEKELFMSYVLADVIVTSVQVGGSSQGHDVVPVEQVTFNYAKITWEYKQLDHETGKPIGNVGANWSTKENKGG